MAQRAHRRCMNPLMRAPGGIVLLALALVVPAAANASDARYALANGCYALQSQSAGKLVAKNASGGYSATAASTSTAEPFRMKATALGHYLFLGRQSDFMGASPGGDVQVALNP